MLPNERSHGTRYSTLLVVCRSDGLFKTDQSRCKQYADHGEELLHRGEQELRQEDELSHADRLRASGGNLPTHRIQSSEVKEHMIEPQVLLSSY